MKIYWTLISTLVMLLCSGSRLIAQENPIDSTYAFVNVQLIPMNQAGSIPGQTVLVHNQRIQAIGPKGEVILPPNTIIIDGTGLYLLPGLTDAHVHLDDKIGARPDFGDAPLFLASGITSVLNLRGEPIHLQWKKSITLGKLLAPNLYTSSEFVNEPRIQTIQEAEAEVERHLREGYDLIKFREVIDFETHRQLTTAGMPEAAYLHLNEKARHMNLPLVGHAPYRVGLTGMLQAGQYLAHLNELSNLYFLPPLDFSQGVFMLLGKYTLVLLIVLAFLWGLGKALGMALPDPSGFKILNSCKSSTLAIFLVLLAPLIALLWILVVPPGLAFGSITLLLALSLLGLFFLLLVILFFIRSIEIIKNVSGYTISKTLMTLILLTALGYSVAVVYWIPFAWRGSDMVMSAVARKCKASGIWVQSTLICQEIYLANKEGYRSHEIAHHPDLTYLPKLLQDRWVGFAHWQRPVTTQLWQRQGDFNKRLLATLNREGVPIMAGTDALGVPLNIPGISLHMEMQLLQESGLSNAEILWTATVAAAQFMGQENEFGTINIGKRADLLLVDGNPLENLTCLQKPKGVMVRGKWLPQERLEHMLNSLAQ